jgi:hypothetical protein
MPNRQTPKFTIHRKGLSRSLGSGPSLSSLRFLILKETPATPNLYPLCPATQVMGKDQPNLREREEHALACPVLDTGYLIRG